MERGLQLHDHIEDELGRAFELYQEFDIPNGIEDLKTTLGYMRNHKDCNGAVGCIGYCLGGFLSVALSIECDIDAAISYYGVNLPALLEKSSDIQKPLLMHISSEDEFVPPEDQKLIIDTMAAHPNAYTHLYEGVNHAFARDGGMHYDGEAANLANSRTKEFLQQNLKAKSEAA